MKEKTPEKSLEELNAGIAKSREGIDGLADAAKELSETGSDASSADGERPQEGPSKSERTRAAWTAFWGKLDHVGTRCKEVTEGLADEIERHPLLGGAAAFGLGFVVAKLLFKRRKKGSKP